MNYLIAALIIAAAAVSVVGATLWIFAIHLGRMIDAAQGYGDDDKQQYR